MVVGMLPVSVVQHLAGTYADTVAPGHDRRAQDQREERF